MPEFRFSHPKAEALAFEENPAAMRYTRGGARKFWRAVSVGTALKGPPDFYEAGRGNPASLAERLDELLEVEAARGPLPELTREIRATQEALMRLQGVRRLH